MSYPGARYHKYHPGTPSNQNTYVYTGFPPNSCPPQAMQPSPHPYYGGPINQEPYGYYCLPPCTPQQGSFVPPETVNQGNSRIPATNQPNFQYSNCLGRKKALFIGINYFGTRRQLSGCINGEDIYFLLFSMTRAILDVHNISQFVQERYGYHIDDIVILTDDQTNPRGIPTKKNIIDAMHWLVKDAKPNDSLFFHYSGHGGQIDDMDGDEEDGSDEVIYPVDSNHAGYITDDIMHNILVRSLPPGCRLTAIFDCCHSGSILDLPFTYSTEGKLKEQNLLSDSANKLLREGPSAKGVIGMTSSIFKMVKKATNLNNNSHQAKYAKASPAEVIMFSGCKDSQTSVDTCVRNQATGAMSWAFKNALLKMPNQSYLQLLNSIRCELYQRYDQKPQLSCSHPIDLNRLFIL
ncbi:unnamed protein product [Pneumocystis jirovecii]|uniref:Peptidase C14 caspase domain-containing protein n=2 Tax=Pneumocystis jirovecii TaxID=42068 RepID=L0PCL6_PNEJI|nr:Ca(2+)-dependent cysteine protease MCA1 [Pneumocystis jirovecii RU7]KTW29034.1 hypothetical protein T551_02308 [Pneumocystis jirovecii RU7]CCJ30141.1 unnamed protein product [Pneumocystis jirovecii]